MDFFSCLPDDMRNELLLIEEQKALVFSDEELEKMGTEIRKCKVCFDFDDTWDFNCFCNKCQKILSGG